MPAMTFFIIIMHLIVKGPAGEMVIDVAPEATVYGNLKRCRQAVEALRIAGGKGAPEIGCAPVELKGEHAA